MDRAISKYLACHTEKTLQLKIKNKKRINIANFVNIYANVSTHITCDDENDSK